MLPVALDGSEVRTLQNKTTGGMLHVIAARGLVFSSWRLTAEELYQVNQGLPVWVVIRGEVVPEFNLTVGNRSQVVPPEIIRRARQNESVINSPEAVALTAVQRRRGVAIELLAWGYAAALVLLGWGALALVVSFSRWYVRG